MFQDNNNCLTHLRFPQKLWYLLNSRSNAIIWGTSGQSILLSYNVLDLYLRCNQSIFKTTHISSFIRQLNLYGFRKVTSHLQDPLCNSSNPDLHEYMHDYFQFGKHELVNNIKRKTWNVKKFSKVMHYNPTDFKTSRSFGSLRLRKARKALQEALRWATMPDIMKIQNNEKNGSQDIVDRNYIEHSFGNTISLPQSSKASSSEYIVPSNDNCAEYAQEMNLSTYIENFRIPIDLNTSMIGDNSVTCDNSEYEYGCTSEEQPIDYKSFLNNNVVVVEVLDHKESSGDIHQTTSEVESNNSWNQITSDISFVSEMFLEQKNSGIKLEENPLPDVYFEDAANTPKCESFPESFEEPWEYKEMLNDVNKKCFPEQEYGTELKELYTQITKTIDILNS